MRASRLFKGLAAVVLFALLAAPASATHGEWNLYVASDEYLSPGEPFSIIAQGPPGANAMLSVAGNVTNLTFGDDGLYWLRLSLPSVGSYNVSLADGSGTVRAKAVVTVIADPYGPALDEARGLLELILGDIALRRETLRLLQYALAAMVVTGLVLFLRKRRPPAAEPTGKQKLEDFVRGRLSWR